MLFFCMVLALKKFSRWPESLYETKDSFREPLDQVLKRKMGLYLDQQTMLEELNGCFRTPAWGQVPYLGELQIDLFDYSSVKLSK